MKLKFSIHYNTLWGQSLHVLISYQSGDGHKRNYDMLMLTQDGEFWTLETSVMESRQHPIRAIEYHYQVEDNEGRLLRKEWEQMPRIYSFDSTKDYLFPDQWHDIPLQSHLYTDAYATYRGLKPHEEVKIAQIPLFRRTLVFRVSAPQLQEKESLGVCGNHPALGNWNPSQYQKMTYLGNAEWMLSVNAYMMMFPIEYKFVIIDDETNQLKAWEEGENRTTGEDKIEDGQVLVLYGENLRVKETTWRMAGVSVPLFSLKSEKSYGVGDFGDLKLLIDWASEVGMHAIQLLPLNDTTHSHDWGDSNPYNIISAFALHPHYLDLESMGELKDKKKVLNYQRQRRELNAYDYSDYPAVDRVKKAYVDDLFLQEGKTILASESFKNYFNANRFWLEDYASFVSHENYPKEEVYYVQYCLYRQLVAAKEYAGKKGVILIGDFPIGISRNSVEVKLHPDYFNLDQQMGTPPDKENPYGQNWQFPTLRWENPEVVTWMNSRMKYMEQFFDAVRIDHIVGYFRIWEIPENAVFSVLGHFSPALPMNAEEINQFGLSFREELYTKPFLNEKIIENLFGLHANYVKEHFLEKQSYGIYRMKSEFDTQQKVQAYFKGKGDENSQWIRDGLYRVLENVLFLEDSYQKGMYHPRFEAFKASVYDVLSSEEKNGFMSIYNNYYSQRHDNYWTHIAKMRFSQMLENTRLLVVGEDLGLLPSCVSNVMDELRMLPLEIQSLPKSSQLEFAHLEANPYRSVCMLSTHDLPSLRLWWEENSGRTQRYYVSMLQKEGRAPQHLSPQLAEEIVARTLYSPSLLCLLSIQDWLSIDLELRSKDIYSERINTPYDAMNRWQYRMNIRIEELMKSSQYNHKIKLMINRSRR
jgi:4-alpha-glucanotransferase